VPVVAYAVGGYRDTVVDGVTGNLVPPRDITALGDTLRRLLADPYRRMQYGAAGVDRARSAYTWQQTARRLLAVYHEVGEPQQRAAAPTAAEPEGL
jgi:glycosyltransferase involved in cell wall biosynthesis